MKPWNLRHVHQGCWAVGEKTAHWHGSPHLGRDTKVSNMSFPCHSNVFQWWHGKLLKHFLFNKRPFQDDIHIWVFFVLSFGMFEGFCLASKNLEQAETPRGQRCPIHVAGYALNPDLLQMRNRGVAMTWITTSKNMSRQSTGWGGLGA